MARGMALLVVLCGAAPAPTLAQTVTSSLNGYLTVATGRWVRGLSQNDGGIVLQAGVDYQHVSGLFAGASAADVDYTVNGLGEPREVEVDAYVGYNRRKGAWSWTVSLGRYFYPDSDAYEYTELGVSVGFRDRLFISTSYSDDFYSLRRPAWSSEVTLAFPLPRDFELSAAVGRFDLDLGDSYDYTHWNVGVSRAVRRLAVDLRYYRSGYDRVTPLGDPGADRYVLSVSYGFSRPRG